MGQKPNNVFKKTHIPVKHKNRGTQKRATKSKFILHYQQGKEPVTNSVKKRLATAAQPRDRQA